ncbi:MAG TPA: Crp/Fnr family transcriptional regulator [Arcobacter sp.]|nr:Crp/Fnr family transcriptional regulator [Arcobacter sp.]HIP55428.1 Crp/Fnr family transcriptional regulator [Arcobacter sp.]
MQKQLDILYPILNKISYISKDTWSDVSRHFKSKSLKEGEHLFYIDDKIEDFYFLIDGVARYYYFKDNGKEFNKSFAQKQGHLISSISSVTQGSGSPFSVEILADCTTIYISYADFINLGAKYKEWNTLTLKIYENLIIKKERRESDFLLLSATQRYENFLQEYEKVALLVPNYHIASYLGITEVALSRIRKELNLT